jgi:hypothetical protein
MSATRTAVATIALAGLLALTAAAGPWLLLAAVVVVVAGVAAGWPALLALPSPRGTAVLVGLTGVAAAAAVALPPAADTDPPLRWLPAVAALGIVGTFVHQLLRRDGRPRLVESVSGAVSGQVLVVLAAGWLAVPERGATGVLPVGAAALAVAAAACALPWPARLRQGVAVVAGTGVAALVAGVLPQVTAIPAAMVGFALAGALSAFDRLLPAQPSARTPPALWAVAAAPLAAGGTAVYVLGLLLLG